MITYIGSEGGCGISSFFALLDELPRKKKIAGYPIDLLVSNAVLLYCKIAKNYERKT